MTYWRTSIILHRHSPHRNVSSPISPPPSMPLLQQIPLPLQIRRILKRKDLWIAQAPRSLPWTFKHPIHAFLTLVLCTTQTPPCSIHHITAPQTEDPPQSQTDKTQLPCMDWIIVRSHSSSSQGSKELYRSPHPLISHVLPNQTAQPTTTIKYNPPSITPAIPVMHMAPLRKESGFSSPAISSLSSNSSNKTFPNMPGSPHHLNDSSSLTSPSSSVSKVPFSQSVPVQNFSSLKLSDSCSFTRTESSTMPQMFIPQVTQVPPASQSAEISSNLRSSAEQVSETIEEGAVPCRSPSPPVLPKVIPTLPSSFQHISVSPSISTPTSQTTMIRNPSPSQPRVSNRTQQFIDIINETMPLFLPNGTTIQHANEEREKKKALSQKKGMHSSERSFLARADSKSSSSTVCYFPHSLICIAKALQELYSLFFPQIAIGRMNIPSHLQTCPICGEQQD